MYLSCTAATSVPTIKFCCGANYLTFAFFFRRINSFYAARLKFTIFLTLILIFFVSINLLAFYHECRSLIGYATVLVA